MATRDRYHRQRLLACIGDEGQDALARAHAIVIGCGALGAMSGQMLARAGVGRLTLVDRDVVEQTNLQRQVLFDEKDAQAGVPKAEAARRRLGEVNSSIEIEAVVDDLRPANAERIAHRHGLPGVIVDGTDNFETRYLLNDLCVALGVPFVYAGAVGTGGLTMNVLPRADARAPWAEAGATPCLRCVFPEMPAPGSAPTCDTAGVLGPVATMIASVQAVEAIKILAGRFDAVRRTLLSVDAWTNEWREIRLDAVPGASCPCCAARSFEFLEGRRGSTTTILCGRESVQVYAGGGDAVDLAALASRLRAHGRVTVNEFLLRASLDEAGRTMEMTVFADGRAIVGGTTSGDVARSIYARYVGA